jgi:hypothetical protein
VTVLDRASSTGGFLVEAFLRHQQHYKLIFEFRRALFPKYSERLVEIF